LHRYTALIDGEAGAYGVSFPDLPGCVAMGRTVDEAVLAQVTTTASGAIGQNRLAWVVVVHSKYLMLPASGCAPPRPNGPACAARRTGDERNLPKQVASHAR